MNRKGTCGTTLAQEKKRKKLRNKTIGAKKPKKK